MSKKNKISSAIKDVAGGVALYQVWIYQAYLTLTSKYKRTFLGTFWIAGHFISFAIATSILFSSFFKQNIEEILPHNMGGMLAAGMSLWFFTDGPNIFVANTSIIRNHATPKSYFVFEGAAKSLMYFLHNLVVFYVMLAVLNKLVIPHYTIVLGIIANFATMFVWGSIMGILAARYRDIAYLAPSISNMIFLITPIYWGRGMLGKNTWIADLNPFYGLVSVIREPLLGVAPTMHHWILTLGFLGVGIVIFAVVFTAFRSRIAFWV